VIILWSLCINGKDTDFAKGIIAGESACRYRKITIEDRYDELDLCWYKYHRAVTYRIDESLRKAQDLYFEYLEKDNKSAYENGFLEGVKLFLNTHREEYYLREYAKISPSVFCNVVNLLTGELPPQEIVSTNQTRPRKKNNIEWTEEDDKLIYSAVKKYTSNFTSLPAGHTREDVLQEAAQAWAKRLTNKGGHDPAKGKKSTLLYRVVQNTIQDLIKAANTDKRKVNQHLAEFNDVYSIDGYGKAIGPSNKENAGKQYEGGESNKNLGKGDFEPTRRGTKDAIRWNREKEAELTERIKK